jgi:hypothetical protein
LKNLRKEDRRKFPGLFENIHQLCVAAAESPYPCYGFYVGSWVHTFPTMPVADKGEVLWKYAPLASDETTSAYHLENTYS